jgi:hypothetical protein
MGDVGITSGIISEQCALPGVRMALPVPHHGVRVYGIYRKLLRRGHSLCSQLT